MIRDATRADRSVLTLIGKVQAKRYPKLKADVEKIHEVVTEAIDNPGHYCRVLVDGDKTIRGALLALTCDHLWAQRKSSQIIAWYANQPGAGAKLLRDYRDWVKSGRFVKVAGMTPDLDLDPRILKIAERTGFTKHGGAYLLYN
jgi:hypothetical protein